MLPKRLRLPRAGFAAQKSGKRLISLHFSLIAAPASSKKGGVAVVISAKVVPKAVDRHRLKRQLAALLRPIASPKHALVIHVRAGAAALSFADIKGEMQELAAKSGLLAR